MVKEYLLEERIGDYFDINYIKISYHDTVAVCDRLSEFVGLLIVAVIEGEYVFLYEQLQPTPSTIVDGSQRYRFRLSSKHIRSKGVVRSY